VIPKMKVGVSKLVFWKSNAAEEGVRAEVEAANRDSGCPKMLFFQFHVFVFSDSFAWPVYSTSRATLFHVEQYQYVGVSLRDTTKGGVRKASLQAASVQKWDSRFGHVPKQDTQLRYVF
jgi:hypothetical protein